MNKNQISKNKVIKLIYDNYENDIGIVYDTDNENKANIETILNNLPNQIDNKEINKNRNLIIYSWGVKKDKKEVECDIIFDLRKFQTKINEDIDVHTINGLSNIIQDSIILHPKFLELIGTILTHIETENPKKIAFICNHGKHRSVGWTEILQKLIYNKAIVKHLCRKTWQ